MVRAGYMERDMSKTKDTTKLGPATQVRELRDDELQQVSGGWHQSIVEGQISALRVSIATSEVFELNT
jgi:bacteriocin-like protein